MLPDAFALEVEATYKQEHYQRLAARERAGRAVMRTQAGVARPEPWAGLRATAAAARDGLAVGSAWLRSLGWIAAARRRPVA